ncbi:MAG: MgtC/SapB family protein [Acidobacteria bacterium]|nr:MAG: MgtC/SapB family protein [Acidobacteriota bacterium]
MCQRPGEKSTDLRTLELVGRLLVAALLGAAVGLEREVHHKAAGVRTNALIALGASLFTVLSQEMVPGVQGDPSRIAAGIVTGIGFVGGGAILRTGGSIQGLTTAATIWVNAGIGLAAGAGEIPLAVAGAGVTLLVLVVLNFVELRIERREKRRNEESQGR